MRRAAEFQTTAGCCYKPDSAHGAESERKSPQRNRAAEHSSEEWTSDCGPLRAGETAVDFFPSAGFLRYAGHAAYRAGQDAAGRAPLGSEPPCGADDDGSCRILGAPLPAGAARTDAPLSKAPMA